ncbi:nuclear transport factor 2 family protein [Novosphingobium sp. JCM 18896]|uniref:nuclear transport factor 2 family protein n=1 Tax=Novosphingobium sp. JCM 18896 TaxID=2989731 RepID=UPI00222238D5|nr:nuclear transport factor 2 family protein [Novosphingobium sp. JCM 18896]MCW1428323.1 nuclear transport factor 2 family protein [Novosphingobium sp. JCM 18896]
MPSDAEFQRLADELAVRRVLDEYCLRLEVNDFEEWLDLFTDDTVYEVYRRELKGRDAVRDMLSKAPHGVHLGGPMRITLDGDRAETIQNYLFIAAEDAAWNMGWYFRTVVRTADGWKIAHTKVQMQKIGSGTPPLLATN